MSEPPTKPRDVESAEETAEIGADATIADSDAETDADTDTVDGTDVDADAENDSGIEPVNALDAAAADVGWPDFEAENGTRDLLHRLRVPAIALGRLQEVAVWLSGAQGASPPREPQQVRAVVFAADHGVSALGVTPPAPSTSARVREMRAGRGFASIFAASCGAGVRVVDVGVDDDDAGPDRVRRSSERVDHGAALTPAEVELAVATGARIADEEVDSGADLLIAAHVGVGADIVAAAIVSVMTNTEPVKALGLTSHLDDESWMRAMIAVRDAHRYGAENRYDIMTLLGRIGGTDFAALTGFVLRAAARRTPVLLDGPVVCAAALMARDVSPRAIRWWQAGSRTPGQTHAVALEELQLVPLLDLEVDLDEGVGSLLSLSIVRAAVNAVVGLAIETDASAQFLEPTTPPSTDV